MNLRVLRDPMRRIEVIQQTTVSYYGISIKEMRGPDRSPVYSFPRAVAMFLCRRHTDRSFTDIGAWFGGRDHTTVIAACRKIEALKQSDRQTADDVRNIEMWCGFEAAPVLEMLVVSCA
jgi:chromosomal replication initiator protein